MPHLIGHGSLVGGLVLLDQRVANKREPGGFLAVSIRGMRPADSNGGPATDRPQPEVPSAEVCEIEWETAAVHAAQDGEPGAFDKLVLGYQDRIYNLIQRMVGDADESYDLAQETFVKAFEAIGSFRRDARFSTWIYRIAVNACLSRHRKRAVRKRHAPVSLDAAVATEDGRGRLEPADLRDEPVSKTARRETSDIVHEAIQALDIEYRTVVLLRDMEGYSYGEIQDILGCPIGTVRSRLHRARAELGRKLRGAMGME